MFAPPADINIEREQKWIDDLMGQTNGGQSIYKLVWNGDTNYWYEFFHEWNVLGKPTALPVKRPRQRYGVINDATSGKFIRDAFPPRWLLLTRLEPQQYAEGYRRESWIYSPEINCMKLIRPEEPPPVFWMPYSTIAAHSDYCCAKEKKCFGKYAPPSHIRPILEEQKRASEAEGYRNPFEQVDYGFISELEFAQNTYLQEIKQMEVDRQIAMATPWALLGPEASMRAGIETTKQAEQVVRDYFDRKIQRAAKKL